LKEAAYVTGEVIKIYTIIFSSITEGRGVRGREHFFDMKE
jgi:hypothetical protein